MGRRAERLNPSDLSSVAPRLKSCRSYLPGDFTAILQTADSADIKDASIWPKAERYGAHRRNVRLTSFKRCASRSADYSSPVPDVPHDPVQDSPSSHSRTGASSPRSPTSPPPQISVPPSQEHVRIIVDAVPHADDLLLLSLDRAERSASYESIPVRRQQTAFDLDPASRIVPDRGNPGQNMRHLCAHFASTH